MDGIQKEEQNQRINRTNTGIFSDYFESLKVGKLLRKAGIRKTKGASPLFIFTIVFNLSFMGKNLYEGVVRNKTICIGKDAVYSFLNSSTYNWRLIFPFIICPDLYSDPKPSGRFERRGSNC